MEENRSHPDKIIFRYSADMASPYRSLTIRPDEVSLEEDWDALLWAADTLDHGDVIVEDDLVNYLMEGYGACSYCSRIAADFATEDENSKGHELMLAFDDLMQRARICVCEMQRRIQELLDRFGGDETGLEEALRDDLPDFVSETLFISDEASLLFRDLLQLTDSQQDEGLPVPELLDFLFEPPAGPAS